MGGTGAWPRTAIGRLHSLVGWPSLEPALEAVLEFRREWRHDLVRIRQDVLRELRELVEDAEDDTAAWLETLPAHVRATYVTKDRPRPFQGIVFDRLLRGVGYPAADDLQQDVNVGFDMLGSVRPAPGWRPRSDERYAQFEGLDRLRRENPLYVARKSARPRDQEHTQALLDELVAETRKVGSRAPAPPLTIGRCLRSPCPRSRAWGSFVSHRPATVSQPCPSPSARSTSMGS